MLRERINEAAKSNLLKFARGEDLDNLAEFYGVERQKEEDDERFRKRVKARIVGWSTGGSKEHYRYHALSADSRVKDALVESPIPGKVQISILSTAANQQIAVYTKKKLLHLDELLEVIRKQINKDDVRILTDTVTVVSCNIIPIDIHTKVTAQQEDIIETARKQFIEKFESSKKLGWNITKS